MENQETKSCQNCKQNFEIVREDFDFYEKMEVPPPTWCPQCRMIRRMMWFNPRQLFRRPDSRTGKDIFASFPASSPLVIYDRDYWWTDAWDPMNFGKDIDFGRPFLEQVNELMLTVPWPSRSAINLKDSDFVANVSDGKSSYLCFAGGPIENSAYTVVFNNVKEGFDLYESRHSELCYDSYMVDEAYRVFFSVNVEDCTDIWFSRNLTGCTNCFGCVNLRSKNNYIFNKPVSKEEYQKFISKFKSGSFSAAEEMRKKSQELWLQYPMRFTLAINVVNSSGEHIERTKNVHQSYSIHEGENLKFCQFLDNSTDSYDHTRPGKNTSLVYESCIVAFDSQRVKFSAYCYSGATDNEYCVTCPSSTDIFGCVGLRKKQYCILNKQYSKEEYKTLVVKIKQHMIDMPYVDKQGRVYKYGEFLPPEFTPWAYNESLAQDYFPLAKEQAEAQGYLWREPEVREFNITQKASELPDDMKDVTEDIVKEVIGCSQCGKAYRIIPMELNFYRRIPLPLPRLCVECRFQRRFKFVNPPKFWPRSCQCAGVKDDGGIYSNGVEHFHGKDHCPNKFESSYEPGRPDIVYCESCYQQEVI